MRETDNKGFSLIELLIAVCILGIIVIPLLNSFVSSYRMNARSRQTLRATTLAQNEMEIFEKESIEDLCSLPEFVYDSSVNPTGYQVSTSSSDGCYSFKREGIINDESGRAMFDIYVELNPLRENASDRYYDENMRKVLDMSTISTKDSGTYVQKIRTLSSGVDEDSDAYTYFYNNKLAGCMWPLSWFETDVSRVITLDISQYDDGGKTYTRAKVTYDYSLNNASVMPADMMNYKPVEKVIYDNTQNTDEAGNPVELKSIYLFFAPRFSYAGAINKYDTIVVNNASGLPVDIYVIRQEMLLSGATEAEQTEEVPIDYKSKLIIYDKTDADGTTQATYHTNLNIDKPDAAGEGQKVLLEFTDTGVAVSPPYARNDIIDMTGLKALDAASFKDRIYEMTVRVYETGDDVSSAPLVTLTGTKLN